MDYLKADWPPSLIREWLNLTPHQIADVMVYISAHRDEIEAEYQEVLNQAKKNRDFWEERNRDRLSRISRFPEKPGQEAAIAKLRSRSSELRPS